MLLLCNYYVTYRCNAYCEFCHFAEHSNFADIPHASLDDFKKNVTEMRKLGVKFIDLTGGEPLLNPSIHLMAEFAQSNKLNEKNLLNCHKIFSDTLLIRSKRGKYRIEQVGVFGKAGLAYMAVEPEFVEKEMKLFFQDLSELILSDLNEIEVFYFASLIHLRFAHIHPFRDGNGRAARLIEKWFITEKLGHDFWRMPSEEFYKKNQAKYYETINLGVNYYELNYDRCVRFLEMLPNCLK